MIYVVAVLLFLILAILFYKFVIKKNVKDEDKNYKVKETDKSSLEIKDKFMFQIELKILANLNEACGNKFIALPKVNLGSLLKPVGSKVAYNALADKVLDFVIFEKQTMKAVLVVDIYDETFTDESMEVQDPSLTKLLNDLNLPILPFYVKYNYDAEALKKSVKEKLEPKKDEEEAKQ